MHTYFHLILIWLIDIAISDVLKSLSVVIQDSSESDVSYNQTFNPTFLLLIIPLYLEDISINTISKIV
jgi:hypothetical protein